MNSLIGRLKAILLFFFLLLSSVVLLVSADWGTIPVIPGVSVYEPAQKAIVAWNGQQEILILSADVTSNANTTVLQIMPLPSNPMRIEEASSESFYVVEELIWYHAPPPPPNGYWYDETDRLKVVFHEKIGMHDITVVEAYDVSEFAEWMDEFLLRNGISEKVSLENFDLILEDYMLRGFHFYVLDLIESSSEQKSVEPILYEFDTGFLYYPLLITSPIGGDGKIILFLLTQSVIESGYDPLTKAQYTLSTYPYTTEPIQFELSNEELSLIDFSIGKLFDKAWLTALTYEGQLDKLTEDLMMTLLTGDLNVDGRVDIHDLWITAQAFSSYPGHPRWNSKADINNNGVVNIIDILAIVRNFGKTL